MLVPAVAGLAIACAWGLAGTLSARGARASDAASATAWGAIGGAVVLAPVIVAFGPAVPSGGEFAEAIPVALCTLGGNMALFAAMRRGRIALVAPLAALYGPFAALLAVLGGESISATVAASFALVIVGMTLIVSARQEAEEASLAHGSAIAFALLAAVMLGVGLVGATDVGGRIGGMWMLAVVEVLGALVFGLPLLVRARLAFVRETIVWNTAGSCVTSVGYLTYIAVSDRYGVAITATLTSLQCVIGALLSAWTLRERLDARQIAGGVAIAAALTLLAATA